MKVVALVSGGKDSCYNMLQCVMAGHEIVALANLKPESKDELDSYMYQTVGHQGVELYAEAMNIPLFRQETQGVAIHNEKLYTPTPEDEVEDLYQLLLNIKRQIDIEAVSVGAVLSDYQRLRVENVCQRLGLVALAYLWRRDQAQLLQEMIDYKINAIIIKVAALGLDPRKHLGLTISQIQPYLVEMNEKYGLNICGEGGEYETFTLDCPLFSKSILINDCETVIHSNDNIAPVGHLSFRHLSLVDKLTEEKMDDMPLLQRLSEFPIKSAEDYIKDIDALEELEQEQSENESGDTADHSPINHVCMMEEVDIKEEEAWNMGEGGIVQSESGWCWVGGISSDSSSCSDIVKSTSNAMNKLKDMLESKGLTLKDLVRVVIYLSSLEDYGKVNRCYTEALGGEVNPPVRVCVGTPLSSSRPVRIIALAYPHAKQIMHVQSLSHWAPANIGPYSQAIKGGESGEIVYVAGQIGLVPGSMELVGGGVRRQCKLALRHISRLIKCMDREFTLGHVVQGVCYVTRSSYIKEVTQEWEKRTKNAIVDFVVVTELPRQADVEFQIWAHLGNNRFQYEETGCTIGNLKASLRRRWNYDNTVSAVVCCVARACSGTLPGLSECGEKCEPLTGEKGVDDDEEVSQVLVYALQRLTGPSEDGAPLPVCSLQIYYALGRCHPETLRLASDRLHDRFLCATTIIPVVALNQPSHFLSICSVRH